MIFRFVAEYSQRSDLRREFARDPNSILDRYDIPEAERHHLIAGDRSQVARQLHAEIDDMLAGSFHAILWPVFYPHIIGPAAQQAGSKGKQVTIAISALNLAPDVKVRFRMDTLQISATILRIDHSAEKI